MNAHPESPSDRDRWELRLAASELRYRRLFEAARDGILILDAASGAVDDVNPFLCELLDLERDEILGRKIWELGPFKDVPASKVNFRELQVKEYIRYDDLPLESSSGEKISVEFVSNLYQVDGKPVIQCNVRDMTQRKRAEAAHALLARAAEQAHDSIVITDASGRIVFVNPAFERLTGWSQAEALGANPNILKSGKQDRDFYTRLWATISSGATWTGTFENQTRDGRPFQETATISPVRDGAGAITHYVAMKRDVTQQVSLERQLQRSQKMELVGRFAGGIAHDFNNLLGVILGYAELLRQELPASGVLHEGVEEILLAADRAGRLTRQILAFGRKQVLQPQVVDLNAVIADMKRMLPRLLGEQIRFSTHQAPELDTVVADVSQLEQVIMNLVLNARDAMPAGGSIHIATENREVTALETRRLSPIPPGAYVLLSVTDTGSGMDAATQARIFEPFFTTKAIGQGSGLGLATVDGIVGQSGGFVAVESTIGRGSTFGVYLPRAEVPLSPQRAPAGKPASHPVGTETVLLVEDESGLRQLLQRVLTRGGYTVLTAGDGAAAEALLKSHPDRIDLLVTDVLLPGARGTELADSAERSNPQTKVLLISGYSEETIAEAGRLGASRAFLGKPFSLELFQRTVRNLLDSD